MSKDFWDARYSEKNFAYGISPNAFFKESLDLLKPGNALFLGEGEGRNAVYAAKLGWSVDAVDFSIYAKNKAISLAVNNNVKINYDVFDLRDYNFKKNYYDLVVMIFLHLPPDLIRKVFNDSVNSLKQNGKIIIEAFSKKHINNDSGGPKSIDLLYSENDFLKLFNELKVESIKSKTIALDEGEHHKGTADVVRFVGVKL
jgi:SAM-dependent methyltransferase